MGPKTTPTTNTTTEIGTSREEARDADSVAGFFVSEHRSFQNDNCVTTRVEADGPTTEGEREPQLGLLPSVMLSFVVGTYPLRYLARFLIAEIAPRTFATTPCSLRLIGTGRNVLADCPERGVPIAGMAHTLTGAGEHAAKWCSDWLAR